MRTCTPTPHNRAEVFRQSLHFSTSPQPDLAVPLPAAFQWLQSEFRLREEEGRGRKEISIKKQSLLNARENGNLGEIFLV